MRYLLAAAAVLALAAPAAANHHEKGEHAAHHGHHDMSDPAMFAKHHAEALSGAVNHPTRAEDRARDAYRHPVETLSFWQVGPQMKVGEYAPGGQWFSRLLGHYLGGEGRLVGLFFSSSIANDVAAKERLQAAAAKYPADVAVFTGLPADRFAAYTLDAVPADQKGTFDRIIVPRMMHNLQQRGIADSELRAMRDLLKDDGLLGIEQHRAKADAPAAYADGSKGYLKEADVIAMFEKHGFELVGKSEINANPKDTADYPDGVWTLPPNYALKDQDKAKYAAIGESDRMTMLFRKK